MLPVLLHQSQYSCLPYDDSSALKIAVLLAQANTEGNRDLFLHASGKRHAPPVSKCLTKLTLILSRAKICNAII
jgi:hypothetical protein